jgi:hypothetical protein
MMRRFISLFFVTAFAFGQEADSLLQQTFPLSPKIHHRPPWPFFEGRPYHLELFSDLLKKDVESLSIFFKTNQTLEYREAALERYRGRYRFKYDPATHPGEEITYFFVAILKNAGSHATPIDENGKLAPMILRPIDPVKYYESIMPR